MLSYFPGLNCLQRDFPCNRNTTTPWTELGAPPRLLSMLQRCWDTDMHNRPSFDDFISKLDLSMGWKELELALLYMRKLLESKLNLAKSLLSDMGQCTTAYPYNQLFGALVLKNYERQDATLLSWNLMYIVD
ncbi:unnamed protein product [Lactuca saligna]|uniref:Serine-threonine/tyrosine-protein kinase catalytic domain-containing protein n=1 Tax=Lactuca saligna TaxID=75948 RepID=A0AA35VFJ7_LACSI|nr:unnamed protein product [Lactuca saligna]